VTGGGSGLGRAMALALASAGADVAIAGRKPEPIAKTAHQIRSLGRQAIPVAVDLTDTAAVDDLFSRVTDTWGGVDVLINNAGLVANQGGTAIWDVTDYQWRNGIEGILGPSFYCSRAIARQMAERGSGKIVNIASGLGMRGARDNYMYACAKGAVIQLTRSLAVSLGHHGVTANCITSGYVPTEGTLQSSMSLPRAEFVPLGRLGKPKDLGPLAVWLASAASNYVTGAVIAIDGGGLAGGIAPTGHAPLFRPSALQQRKDSIQSG